MSDGPDTGGFVTGGLQRQHLVEGLAYLVFAVGGHVRQDHVDVADGQSVAGGSDDRAVQGIAVWRHRCFHLVSGAAGCPLPVRRAVARLQHSIRVFETQEPKVPITGSRDPWLRTPDARTFAHGTSAGHMRAGNGPQHSRRSPRGSRFRSTTSPSPTPHQSNLAPDVPDGLGESAASDWSVLPIPQLARAEARPAASEQRQRPPAARHRQVMGRPLSWSCSSSSCVMRSPRSGSSEPGSSHNAGPACASPVSVLKGACESVRPRYVAVMTSDTDRRGVGAPLAP